MVIVSGRPESTLGNNIMEVTKVIPTIWPLVFAAIVGAMLKIIALWKAQSGTTLGVCDYFQNQTKR